MKTTTIPRTCYLPRSVHGTEPVTPEGTDLEIWTWEEGDKIYGIAFAGKSNKPLWNYRFMSEKSRAERIAQLVESRRQAMAEKAARAAAKKAFKHDLKVGDVLKASWGYDQTNVDFFEVVSTTEKTVKVRPVGKSVVRSDSAADYVVPVPGDFRGGAILCRPTTYGVKIDDVRRADRWSGKPSYQTGSFAGH
jgi:hypothetical protein